MRTPSPQKEITCRERVGTTNLGQRDERKEKEKDRKLCHREEKKVAGGEEAWKGEEGQSSSGWEERWGRWGVSFEVGVRRFRGGMNRRRRRGEM